MVRIGFLGRGSKAAGKGPDGPRRCWPILG
jgi:hypothetical protein